MKREAPSLDRLYSIRRDGSHRKLHPATFGREIQDVDAITMVARPTEIDIGAERDPLRRGAQ